MKKFIIPILAAASALVMPSCETLSVNETPASAPVIDSFSPKSAPAGAGIVVTGEHLNNVTSAWIGDVEVEIIEKVSDKRLSIEVGNTVKGGRIRLENATGSGTSAEDFTCIFAVPEITVLTESADFGENILVTGKNLNSVAGILFKSAEDAEGYEAEIITQSDEEIVLRVPYVAGEDATVSMAYYDETGLAYTSYENTIQVVKHYPDVEYGSFGFERTAVGSSITVTGRNLDNVSRVTVRRADPQTGESAEEFDAVFTATSESLSFSVPAADFPDGDTQTVVRMYRFDDHEYTDFTNRLTVYVPLVYFWENVTVECQSQNEDALYRSFFSPQDGKAYANADWATVLDPIAMKYNGAMYSTNNVFNDGTVTEEEYYSVLPYFFFSYSGSSKILQLNAPAWSNGQLKNFQDGSGNSITGNKDSKTSGTPLITFRVMNAQTAEEAELIRRVVNGEIENIDETLFPIDVEAKTINGIKYSGASGGLKQNSNPAWPGVSTPEGTENTVQDLSESDCVILMAYYSYKGYNADNRTENIRRIGILHLKKIDWIQSNNDWRGTQITFDCYWQKYDYDYSKVNGQ